MEETAANGNRVSFGGDKNILKLNSEFRKYAKTH